MSEGWTVARDEKVPLNSFSDLFRHPKPPVALLKLTKEFAKSSDRRSASPLPPEIATVLYYAAIVTALLRHGSPISRLSLRALKEGVTWALEQPWLDEQMRGLFDEARAALAGAGQGTEP
jgi:hypothetical protein